jgi:arylsulfatase A-like enzyme
MVACPLAYRPPGGMRHAQVVERPIAMLDIVPTLLGQLGLEIPSDHQGRQIPELLGQPSPSWGLPVLSEMPPFLYSLRLRNWKLIRRGSVHDPEWQLFDLTSDPSEQADVSAALPDTTAMLRSLMEDLVSAHVDLSDGDREVNENPELLRRLRDLGYVR